MHLLEEEVCRAGRIDIRRKEMIGPTDKPVLVGLVYIIVKVLVNDAYALGCYDDYKAERLSLDGSVTETTPVNTILIVTDVDTSDIISFRVVRFTVDCLPPKGVRTYKKIVKDKKIGGQHKTHADNVAPYGNPPPEGFAKLAASPTGRILPGSSPGGLPPGGLGFLRLVQAAGSW